MTKMPKLLGMPKIPKMAPSPHHSGVLRMSRPNVGDTSAGVRVDTRRGLEQAPPGPTAPVSSSASFSIHFCNIWGLALNFPSVEQHLATSLPNLLLLSETQLSSETSSNLFDISDYGIISRFCFKGVICAYYNNTPIKRLTNYESPNVDVLWLRIFKLSTSSYAFVTYPQTQLMFPPSLIILLLSMSSC